MESLVVYSGNWHIGLVLSNHLYFLRFFLIFQANQNSWPSRLYFCGKDEVFDVANVHFGLPCDMTNMEHWSWVCDSISKPIKSNEHKYDYDADSSELKVFSYSSEAQPNSGCLLEKTRSGELVESEKSIWTWSETSVHYSKKNSLKQKRLWDSQKCKVAHV